MENIVILGAGFGGLRAALILEKKFKKYNLDKDYQVILVDRNNYHTYTPTLYEAATTSKETANYLDLKGIVTFPIQKIIENKKIKFIQAEILNVDLIEGDIHLTEIFVSDFAKQDVNRSEPIKFDYLIIALGSESNDFGIPGIQKYGLNLKTFLDALKIRDSVLDQIGSETKTINVVIGGGGSTGVEIAGELREWLCEFKERRGECNFKIGIIEAAPTILSLFHPGVVSIAVRRLKRLGVELISEETIEKVEKNKVVLKSGRIIPYDVFIWTGGIKAPDLLGEMPLKQEKRGRVEVESKMECLPQTPDLKLYGKIYGIGDNICFYDPLNGKPIPQVARAAILQAGIAAHNICEDIKAELGLAKKARHKIYKPIEYPYVIPIGGKFAVAKLGPLIISGFFGWVLKGLVELNYLISIMSLWKAMKIWLKGLWIFIQNDRLG